jgi:hypothetical protein
VNEGLPAASRIADDYRSFMLQRSGSLQFPARQREFLFGSLEELLGEREPDFFLTLELGGDIWILVVVEKRLHLIHPGEQDVEICFLGRLRGSYAERIVWRNGAATILRFEDPRLPGGALEIEVEPPPSQRAFEDHQGIMRRAAIEKLRPLLREWAAIPR